MIKRFYCKYCNQTHKKFVLNIPSIMYSDIEMERVYHYKCPYCYQWTEVIHSIEMQLILEKLHNINMVPIDFFEGGNLHNGFQRPYITFGKRVSPDVIYNIVDEINVPVDWRFEIDKDSNLTTLVFVGISDRIIHTDEFKVIKKNYLKSLNKWVEDLRYLFVYMDIFEPRTKSESDDEIDINDLLELTEFIDGDVLY